jgi:radical SAM superfamily enzyme YgiQ (UPF0313 family)
LRSTIRKRLTDEELFDGIAQASAAGLDHIKLYFIIGLPDETPDDRAAIVQLVETLVRSFPECKWTVGMQPFIPKPHTCMQDEGTPDMRTMRHLLKELTNRLATLPRVEVQASSARWSAVQTAISRGSARLAPALVEASVTGADFSALRRLFAEAGHDLDEAVAPLDVHARHPWDCVDPVCSDRMGS